MRVCVLLFGIFPQERVLILKLCSVPLSMYSCSGYITKGGALPVCMALPVVWAEGYGWGLGTWKLYPMPVGYPNNNRPLKLPLRVLHLWGVRHILK